MQISNEDNLTTELLYKNRNVSILFSYKNDDEKKQIETDIQQIIQYVIEDVDKITPYIDIDTKVNIWLGYKNNGPLAMAKADKYGIITQTINCFNIDIDSKYLTVQNHEFGHVIDKVGTREQLSKKPEFNQILKAYKKEYKSHMKTENRPDLIKDQYRNGGAPSEVFAQLCEKWLTEKEDLNLPQARGTPQGRKYPIFVTFVAVG